MKTIIVTGGAGYIGSHTIIELLNQTDYNIVSIDNFINSNADTFDRIEKITGKRVQNLNVDLCNLEALEFAMKKVKNPIGVIHFAALKSVPQSVSNPLLYYHNNIASLVNVLKVCESHDIKHFIFSSSCSVYGNVDKLPVTEQTPFGFAESPYAHTKQMGEEIIKQVVKHKKNINSVLLRYFNPVGAHVSGFNGEYPRNRPDNLVPFITQTAAGILEQLTVFGNDYDTRDGSCIRDYIHVTDIANAHVKALHYLIDNKQQQDVSIFNLGTGNGVSVLEAIQSFEKVSEQKLNYKIGPRRAGDVINIYANNDCAKQELNWQTEFDLDAMMLSAWKWQLNLGYENS